MYFTGVIVALSSHRVEHSTPDKFFTSMETQETSKLCTWVGELYLELHRGTYTTQAKVGVAWFAMHISAVFCVVCTQ